MTYQGQIMSWRVEACRKYKLQEQCATSLRRTLSWPLPPPAWRPLSSSRGTALYTISKNSGGNDVLKFSLTDVFGANKGYLVCLATTDSNLSQCSGAPTLNLLGKALITDPFVYLSVVSEVEIPLSMISLFGRQRVKVIAAACRVTETIIGYQCTYQRPEAKIEISLP